MLSSSKLRRTGSRPDVDCTINVIAMSHYSVQFAIEVGGRSLLRHQVISSGALDNKERFPDSRVHQAMNSQALRLFSAAALLLGSMAFSSPRKARQSSAASRLIRMEANRFSPAEIRARAGDTLMFVNGAGGPHNGVR
jgi:hypothetical protein